MLQVSVKHDFDNIRRYMNRVQKRDLPKAATTALNKTAKNVSTEVKREISKDTGLKQKDVASQLSIRKANWGSLTAFVRASGRTFNLIRLATPGAIKNYRKKPGLVAKGWGKPRRPFKGVFVGNKERTAFIRETGARLPIRPAFGPSIPRAMVTDSIKRHTEKVIRDKWPKNFGHELQRLLKRRGRR